MPGEKGYFCGWDTLGNAGHAPSSSAENVMITGYEGGVRVYRVTKKDKPELIGYLTNLKGAVLDAKILSWTFSDDPGSDRRPYIALVIHGPVIEEAEMPQNSSDESAAVSTEDDNSPAPSERPVSRRGNHVSPDEAIKAYRTTVEIYSLATCNYNESASSYIETIYATPSVPFKMPMSALSETTIPKPVGDLKLDANGKFLVVASGESGEIFVYSPASKSKSRNLETIRCIGKLWTRVEKRVTRRVSSSQSSNRQEMAAEESELTRSIPLFSLSHRFLAIVPPLHSTYSINGTAHLGSSSRKPPGIHNHSAPPAGPATCDTDENDTGDFVNRMSREMTQGAIVLSKKAAEFGKKTWDSYYNGSASHPGWRASYPQGPHTPYFPPTHGYTGPIAEKQESHVAIFDLQRFLDSEEVQGKVAKGKHALSPIASFDLATGCSWVSFAPSGLHLLTVSRNGDVQNVWSLMRMKDARAGPSSTGTAKPMVRNIFRSTRMTITKVIDVVWFEPHGQRFALLSENGTVHIHDIPRSRFKWPPTRQTFGPKTSKQSQNEESSPAPTGYGGLAMNAFSSASQFLQSAHQRSLKGQLSLGVGSLALAPANFSKKAGKNLFKHGVKAITQGAHDLYTVKDNKLSLKTTLDVLRPRSIRLLTGRSLQGYLGVVAAGQVHLYQIKTVVSSQSTNGPTKYHAKISKKAISYGLKDIPSDKFAPAVRAFIEGRTSGTSIQPSQFKTTSYWHPRAPVLTSAPSSRTEDWRNMVEFATNPAHIAFHQDGRVSLYGFPEPKESPPSLPDRSATEESFQQYDADRRMYEETVLMPHIQATHHIGDSSPWLFGEQLGDLRLIKEGSGGYMMGEDEDGDLEYNMVKLDDGTGTLVMNTVPRSSKAEEEFFEDGAELVDYSEGIGRA
jgi:hypothetical protein